MLGEVEGEIALTPLADAVEKRKPINRDLYELAGVLAE